MPLHKTQKIVASDTHRFRVLLAGRRWGKTILAIEEMLIRAVAQKNRRIVYVAPTYQAARDIAWAQLKSRVQGVDAEINESRLEMIVPTQDGGTSKIMLRSWDNIETLRGQYFDFIVLDEVAMYRNFWEGWHEVLRPALSDRKGGGLFISTPKGFNHFYDLYKTNDPDYKSFHYTTYDNPHVDDEEIDKAKEEVTDDRFAQEYLADFRKQEGLVYKEFVREVHTYGKYDIDTASVMGGLDFGYTHPAAFLKVVKDRRGRYFVTDEWYKTGKTDAEIAEYVAAQNCEYVYPDPAQPQGIKELTNKHVNVRDVNKGADSVRNGIQKIRELFKQGRLKIDRKCVNLIHELETYAYKEGTEDPLKENDDACDALRYIIMMQETDNTIDFAEQEFQYTIDEQDYQNESV